LNKPITNFIEETKEYYEQTKQGIKDWKQIVEWFPDGNYQDIEGLCKIVSLDEVKENENTLTPGRFVGYTIQVDKEFDYAKRLQQIKNELDNLTNDANAKYKKLQSLN
jgi:type I restriction enzyme M protein